MHTDWFFGDDRSAGRGPFDDRTLVVMARSGQLRPDHIVWRSASAKTARAKDIRGLFPNVQGLEPATFAQSTTATTTGTENGQGDSDDSDDKSFWSLATNTLSGFASTASSAGATIQAKFSGLTEVAADAYAGSSIQSAISHVDGKLDDLGVKRAVGGTAEAVMDKLDQVTGKRLVEMLEEKLRLQDEYNDILATRLAEALERIQKLEARLNRVH